MRISRIAASVWAVTILAGTACGRRERPSPSVPPAVSDGAAPPVDGAACAPGERATATAPRFDCTRDADCVNNCKFGAIHRQWSEWLGPGCDDGCASDDQGTARCVDGKCTAFLENGKRDASCTGLPAPDVVCTTACPPGQQLRSTAGRFDCASDKDCANNCQFGAINVWWDQ